MNIRERAETFSRFVGLELKGKITTQGYTAKAVAIGIGRQPAAFNRWLNGKVEIPMSVFCEACEFIDVEPAGLIEDAYARLAVNYGERDGRLYSSTEEDELIPGGEAVVGTPDNVGQLIVGSFGQDDATEQRKAAFDAKKIKRRTDDSEFFE